jgi:hypothetical protein
MPKSTSNWNPSEYATVAERITLFRAAYPMGRIVTSLHSRDDRQVTFRAAVYRHDDDVHPAATGWATEREGDGDVNLVACLENTETSAIGRALANLGFSASRHRASLEEIIAARRRGAPPVRLVRETPVPDATGQGVAPRDANPELQAAANALTDVLQMLAEAERLGMHPRQVGLIRRTLGGRAVPPSAIGRAERALRAWFEEHVPAPVLAHAPPTVPEPSAPPP